MFCLRTVYLEMERSLFPERKASPSLFYRQIISCYKLHTVAGFGCARVVLRKPVCSLSSERKASPCSWRVVPTQMVDTKCRDR